MSAPRSGRLGWFTPDGLDPDRRAVYDRITSGARAGTPPAFALTDAAGRLYGPFNAMLLNPWIGDLLERLGGALRYRGALDNRCREIAILTVAQRARSEFEWYAHERIGRAVGLTDAEIAAVKAGRPADEFSTREQLVYRVCCALCDDGDLDDELFALAGPQLGSTLLDELVTLVGYYQLLALSLRVWRTPLPPEADPAFSAGRS